MTDFAVQPRVLHAIAQETAELAEELTASAAALDVSAGNPQFHFSAVADQVIGRFRGNLEVLAGNYRDLAEGLEQTAAAYEQVEAINTELATRIGVLR